MLLMAVKNFCIPALQVFSQSYHLLPVLPLTTVTS